jgi:glutathione S-transferase
MDRLHVLTYFNVRGRGELIRLLFHAAGIPFTDNRLRLADFKVEQANGMFPSGQVPVLDVDGKAHFSQSYAIAMYAASIAGLLPVADLDRLRCDMILLNTEDVRAKFVAIRYSGLTGDARLARYYDYYNSTLPPLLSRFEKELGDHEYFIGGSLSLADVAVFNMIGYLTFPACEVQAASDEARALQANCLCSFAGLIGLVARVAAVPGIAKWLRERPQEEHDNVGTLAAIHSHI